jgi:hypothetical protein
LRREVLLRRLLFYAINSSGLEVLRVELLQKERFASLGEATLEVRTPLFSEVYGYPVGS